MIKIICKRMLAEGYVSDHIKRHEQLLGRTLSYGQIGKMTMGRIGTVLVNVSIIITQFGFCVGYFIFLGNTARSVAYEFIHYQPIRFSNISSSFPTKPANFSPANDALWTTAPVPSEINMTVSSKLLTKLDVASNFTLTTPRSSNNFSLHNQANLAPHLLNGPMWNLSSVLHRLHSHVVHMKNPFTHQSLQENKPWTFALLLTIPAPMLILIAFIRNLRKLGPVSVLANFSITGAFAATAIYIIAGEFVRVASCI